MLFSEFVLVDLACFIKMIFDSRLAEQFEEASMHLWELLEERDKAVAGTTCKQCFIYFFIFFSGLYSQFSQTIGPEIFTF